MLALAVHPTEIRKPRHRVRASARRMPGSDLITLRFEIAGAPVVAWPPGFTTKEAGTGHRRDELWKSTCLECFVASTSSSYCEWNFSPDGDWAAYHFDGYRAGMAKAEVTPPSVNRTSSGDRARFEIDLAVGEEFFNGGLAISLTAVIVEKNEAAPFYWALTHAGPKPDFHLRESFTLELES